MRHLIDMIIWPNVGIVAILLTVGITLVLIPEVWKWRRCRREEKQERDGAVRGQGTLSITETRELRAQMIAQEMKESKK